MKQVIKIYDLQDFYNLLFFEKPIDEKGRILPQAYKNLLNDETMRMRAPVQVYGKTFERMRSGINGCAELPFAIEVLAYRLSNVTTNEVLSAIGLR